MEDHKRLPADASVRDVCISVLNALDGVWEDWTESDWPGLNDYIERKLDREFLTEPNGELLEYEINHWDDQPDNIRPLIRLQAAYTAQAFADQGMRAQETGDIQRAWQYATRATYWLGIVLGSRNRQKHSVNHAAELGKLGAAARLAKNPKQLEKQVAKKKANAFWIEEKNEYKDRADFARVMMSKFPCLESQKVIADWTREWDRQSAG